MAFSRRLAGPAVIALLCTFLYACHALDPDNKIHAAAHTNNDNSFADTHHGQVRSRRQGITNDAWCFGGGTVMLNGFSWRTDICVTYLFDGVALTTPAKFAIACVGTFLASVAFQCLYFYRDHLARQMRRRQKLEKRPASLLELGAQSILFGVSSCMGYFIMLLTMTYSTYLFIMVVLGLTAGYFGCSVALRGPGKHPEVAEFDVAKDKDSDDGSTCDSAGLGEKCIVLRDKRGARSSSSSSDSDDPHTQTGEACCQ